MLHAMGHNVGICGKAKHAEVALEDCMWIVKDQLLTLEHAMCGCDSWLPLRRQPGNELTCMLDGTGLPQSTSN